MHFRLKFLFISKTGGAGRPKFNQLEMVTTFTYRPRLMKIDARKFRVITVTDIGVTSTSYSPVRILYISIISPLTCLKCNFGNLHALRRSLYGKCLISEITLVAFFSTFSSTSMSSIVDWTVLASDRHDLTESNLIIDSVRLWRSDAYLRL